MLNIKYKQEIVNPLTFQWIMVLKIQQIIIMIINY